MSALSLTATVTNTTMGSQEQVKAEIATTNRLPSAMSASKERKHAHQDIANYVIEHNKADGLRRSHQH